MADITPRTAILEFAAAHSSTMKTPAKYFSAPQSDLNSTEVRKGRALAEFQRMEEITPRTAILEFAAAHKSTMKTTSRFFSALQSDVNTTDGRKGHALAEFQHNSTMETPARRCNRSGVNTGPEVDPGCSLDYILR